MLCVPTLACKSIFYSWVHVTWGRGMKKLQMLFVALSTYNDAMK